MATVTRRPLPNWRSVLVRLGIAALMIVLSYWRFGRYGLWIIAIAALLAGLAVQVEAVRGSRWARRGPRQVRLTCADGSW
jgi:hypothetical protein